MNQILDPIPVYAIYVMVIVAMFVAFEVGFRVGKWRASKSPDEKEGPTGMLVGALLGLMAFMLAIVIGMAGDRFDTRRSLVLAESNAIGTTYLRAGYLDPQYGDPARNILREYVPVRIAPDTSEQLAANKVRSVELMDELWAVTENLVRANPNSESVSLFTDAVNDTIDLQAARVTAVDARVPQPIILFILIGSVLAVGLVGYNAGQTQRRSLAASILLVVLFSTVISLIIDLNQPTSGFFTVSQQPLITLQQEIGPPT